MPMPVAVEMVHHANQVFLRVIRRGEILEEVEVQRRVVLQEATDFTQPGCGEDAERILLRRAERPYRVAKLLHQSLVYLLESEARHG